jgi:hypothetical protein
MPVVEEDELSDPVRLRDFVDRVMAYSVASAGDISPRLADGTPTQ